MTLSLCLLFAAGAQCTGDCENGVGKKIFGNNSYDGEWKNGQMNGIGILINDGKKIYGEFKDNAVNGYAVMYEVSGKLYVSGKFEANQVIEVLDENIVLENIKKRKNGEALADCIGNCLDGWGKMVSEDGSYYEGPWKNAKMDGIGTLALATRKYYGGFVEGNFEGYGIFYDGSGKAVNSGAFKANNLITPLDEEQTLKLISQQRCTGDCENGNGKYVFSDGNIYKGQWRRGSCMVTEY